MTNQTITKSKTNKIFLICSVASIQLIIIFDTTELKRQKQKVIDSAKLRHKVALNPVEFTQNNSSAKKLFA